MKLTKKLIGYLNRVFEKDPGQVLALRIRYDGTSMKWRVADGMLIVTVTGGIGVNLQIPLIDYTVAELADFIGGLPGYTVEFVDDQTVGTFSSLCFLDASGDQDVSNGDHIYAYTSLLWAYMDATAHELTLARLAITEALLQMAVPTADGDWVDEHGNYYKVPRKSGETDPVYKKRIVAEVIRARGNNLAIADVLRDLVGALSVSVIDYEVQTTAANGIKSYGLFDVTVTMSPDVETSSAELNAALTQTLEVMRDAGTHLRNLRYIRKTTLTGYFGGVLRYGSNVLVPYGGEIPSTSRYVQQSTGRYLRQDGSGSYLNSLSMSALRPGPPS